MKTESRNFSANKCCPVCGYEMHDDSAFCPYCGASIEEAVCENERTVRLPSEYLASYNDRTFAARRVSPKKSDFPEYTESESNEVYSGNDLPSAAPEIPKRYRPLSPWAYFGLSLLFLIPVVGWVFIFVFSLSSRNVNLRNFAMSFLCFFLLIGVVMLVASIFFPEQLQDVFVRLSGLF